MGEFEDCIGEVPGRSSSLFALYTDLSKIETKLELTGVHLRHLPSKADSWRGAAANAFEVALKNEVKQAQRLESGADKAADAILKYAQRGHRCGLWTGKWMRLPTTNARRR